MNLWNLSAQNSAQIQGFDDSLTLAQKTRLQDLGFVVGENVLCVRQLPFSSPRVYQVQSAVYAVEKELAEKVIVHPL